MRRRIIAGMGANSFGMAITIGIQLVSLPLFLHYWDTATYGTWLMLSAIPAYLSMADVGMVTAAGNKMTMAMGKGGVVEANRVFQSAQVFMAVVCGVIGLLAVPLVIFMPLPWLATEDLRVALAAMIIGVLLALFGGLTETVFKSTGRYSTGTYLGSYMRLGEWLGAMLGLMLIGTFASVALAGLAVRLFGTLGGMLLARQGNHGLYWGWSAVEIEEIRSMIKPALSFMVFPLANALSFQGVTLLVGLLFGPSSVALFNTYRTISRVAVQVTAIFSHALWPEFSRLYGQGGNALEKLFRHSAWLGAMQALALSILLYFVAPLLLRLWTHGHIAYEPVLMFLMLLYAAAGGLWHVPRVMLMATNQHVSLASWSLAAGVLVIGLAWVMGHQWGLNGVAVSMLASEMFLVIISVHLALSALVGRGNVIAKTI